MLQEISNWIVAKIPGLLKGTNVHVGWRPQDAPVRCHAFLESGASPVVFDLPDRIDFMLQVATRGETYLQARADAWAIFEALHGTVGWNIPALTSGGQAYVAQVIEALAAPQWIGEDEKHNHEFSTNYMFKMKKAGL
jgi:hypothetical protein